MVDIPDDIDWVDYDDEDLEEDPKEDPEENPEEDVDVELEDDAELIFPYEERGLREATQPHLRWCHPFWSQRTSEIDVAPELMFAPRVLMCNSINSGGGESSSACDSSYVGGLAPWALRCDLETSRARARLTEAELSTNQTKIALLKSKNQIGEKERELLNHDLENSASLWPPSLMMKTLIMPPKAMSEAHMHEVIREQVTTSMAEFMANINREAGGDEAGSAGVGGAGAGGREPLCLRSGWCGAEVLSRGAGAWVVAKAGLVHGARWLPRDQQRPEITWCTYVTIHEV
ncbi:hypothetical protein Tco_0726451 [Tanacetum coccineum]|uniref:Uncharacterized protein n=1 Tax=Tanacetum coccineum TaxID=301880 RepID=A0ABQ4YHX4_9ASTR